MRGAYRFLGGNSSEISGGAAAAWPPLTPPPPTSQSADGDCLYTGGAVDDPTIKQIDLRGGAGHVRVVGGAEKGSTILRLALTPNNKVCVCVGGGVGRGGGGGGSVGGWSSWNEDVHTAPTPIQARPTLVCDPPHPPARASLRRPNSSTSPRTRSRRRALALPSTTWSNSPRANPPQLNPPQPSSTNWPRTGRR